jgi:glutaredoxin 3
MRAQAKKVTLYTTPTCPWCQVAKRYLTENGVGFAEVDISTDRAGLREMVLMTAQHGVPVLRVGREGAGGLERRGVRRLYGSVTRAPTPCW